MQIHFDSLRASRRLILKLIDPLTIDQLNKIPVGFKNNICWNISHLLVTQQLLCYRLSGLECEISEEFIEKFQKGTAPSYTQNKKEFDQVKDQFLSAIDTLEKDYYNQKFKSYNNYTTSLNVTLTSIEEGLVFNTFHEGIHLGVILQLLKLV